MFYLFVLLTTVKTQELPPQSGLLPRNFNYHPFQIRQYLEEVTPAPTKQGPVLFPNDAPPPPRPPLVVTSRPLAESVARSELNNTAAASTYTRPVYRPQYGNVFGGLSNQQHAVSQHNNDVSDRDLDYNEGQNYAFSYVVRDQETGDDFSHKQQSSGSATNGEYRVRLPDGRVQIVSYTADENGYKADVRYDEEPKPNSNHINNDFKANNYNFNNYNANYKTNPTDKYNNYDYNKINYRDQVPVKENQYDSKEYYDYSAENYKNPEPYLFNPSTTRKPFDPTTIRPFVSTTIKPFVPTYFNQFTTASPQYVTTVRPSYEEIKHLFTTPAYVNNIEINSPSSYKFDDVVFIGGKKPVDYNVNALNVGTTPTSYIVSSANSGSDGINSKPVLSDSFYNRINRYLSFKKK